MGASVPDLIDCERSVSYDRRGRRMRHFFREGGIMLRRAERHSDLDAGDERLAVRDEGARPKPALSV
jgi:hypothetical protein